MLHISHGINEDTSIPTEEELEHKRQNYIAEQKQRYNERQIRKYKRLEIGSIDNEEIEKYRKKRIEWQKINKEHCEKYDLRRKYDREKIITGIAKVKEDDIIKNKLGNSNTNQLGGTGKGQFIEKINISDDIYVKLREYEEEIRNMSIEYGVLIDKDRNVYAYTGSKTNLDILDRKLENVIITHNHPEIGSFGKDDYELLINNPKIKELRAVDKDYTYSLKILKPFDKSYNYFYKKGVDMAFRTREEIQHCIMIELKKEGYIKYDRIRKE